MWRRIINRYGVLTPLLFVTVLGFELLMIVHSLDRPMWYDEAWRADFIDRNFHIPIQYRQSYAPISIGIYGFTKAAVLLADNNFVQRLTTYLALIALPFAVYKFCTVFISRRTAQVMLPVSVLSGYILEFGTQNKPYVLDVVVALCLPLLYRRYLEGRLRLWQLISVSLLLASISFAGFFVLPCMGVYLLYDYWRQRRGRQGKVALRHFIIWAAAVGVPLILYLVLFIKPQLTPQLYSYYGDLYLHGSPLHILNLTVKNILSIFNIATPRIFHGVEEVMYVFWTNVQFGPYQRTIIHTDLVLGTFYLACFVFGMVQLYRRRLRMAFWLVIGLTVLEWFTSVFHEWPFGNSRTNLFSLFLILIVTTYGLVTAIAWSFRKQRAVVLGCIIGLVVVLIPYHFIGRAVAGSNTFTTAGEGPDSGDEAAAVLIAQKSKPGDQVIISYWAGPFGFEYYYNYADYTQAYRTRARLATYGYFQAVPFDHARPTASTVWVVDSYWAYREDVAGLVQRGYRVQRVAVMSSNDIDVIKLVKPSRAHS